MDAYHQVLARLYEVTEGKDSKAVDFKELVRGIGFHGNYADIFERLSREGWIAEDKKADFVRITHWGISEVKKSPDAGADQSQRALTVNTNKLIAEVKELGLLLEVFAGDKTMDNLSVVEKKFTAISALLNQIKSDLK
jgi:phage anti-repressor protein